MWGTPPLPGELVAVGEDGVLAVVGTWTGERVRELAAEAPRGSGRPTIGGVTVSPNGDTVWFDVRRRGAPGEIYQLPTDGSGSPSQVATGTFPDVDPAGARLAFVADGAVVVHGIITDEEERWPVTGRVTDLAWTTDGADLLWVRNGTELVWLDRDTGADPQVVTTVSPGETLRLPLGALGNGSVVNAIVTSGPDDPTPERLTVGIDIPAERAPDGMGGARDRAFNATGHWGLRVTGDGTIRWSGSGGIGTVARDYVAADF